MAGEASDDVGSDTIGPLGGDDGRVWAARLCELWSWLRVSAKVALLCHGFNGFVTAIRTPFKVNPK